MYVGPRGPDSSWVLARGDLEVNTVAVRGACLQTFSDKDLHGLLGDLACCGDKKSLQTGLMLPVLGGAAGIGELRSCC
jgi:hypothetical protein